MNTIKCTTHYSECITVYKYTLCNYDCRRQLQQMQPPTAVYYAIATIFVHVCVCVRKSRTPGKCMFAKTHTRTRTRDWQCSYAFLTYRAELTRRALRTHTNRKTNSKHHDTLTPNTHTHAKWRGRAIVANTHTHQHQHRCRRIASHRSGAPLAQPVFTERCPRAKRFSFRLYSRARLLRSKKSVCVYTCAV